MSTINKDVRTDVKEFYANAAVAGSSCCGSNTLYTPELIGDLPADISNFSLGCGNPISAANLQEGETVLDLGSGGGLDCFLAAKQVGPSGHVIGVDMTDEMLEKARAAANRMDFKNAEFRQGYLENLPIEDNSIDVVISNCVINLSPDKPKVFEEIFRVLKPGGRLAVSDIVTQKDIPAQILAMKDSWSSCAAGALPVSEFQTGLENAGFSNVQISAKDAESNLLDGFPNSPLFSALIMADKII